MSEQLIVSEPAQVGLFDYAALDAETRIVIRQRTGEIKTLAKRVAQDIVDIGEKLADVKDRLGANEKFVGWLSAELGWAERTAYNYIAVYQKFGRADFEIGNIATSALYLLAAPSTPPAAIETVRQIAREGGEVTHTVAKGVVKEAKAAEERAKGKLFTETVASAGADDGEEFVEEAGETELDAESPAEETAPAKVAKPVAKPAPAPKLNAAAKEIEQAWRKAEVVVSLRFMPDDKNGRKVLVSIQAEGVDPDGRFNKLKNESDVQFIGPVLELLEDYKRALPAKIAAKKAAKASVKPASKPAAKAAKKGVKA